MSNIKTLLFVTLIGAIVGAVIGMTIAFNIPSQTEIDYFAGGKRFPQASPENLVSSDFSVIDGVSTSTISVGSSLSGTNKDKICVWNGTNLSIISFASNSTSTSIATSTTCN